MEAVGKPDEEKYAECAAGYYQYKVWGLGRKELLTRQMD
jgi:hypothetical protein